MDSKFSEASLYLDNVRAGIGLKYISSPSELKECFDRYRYLKEQEKQQERIVCLKII
jgi:hypothetical protein